MAKNPKRKREKSPPINFRLELGFTAVISLYFWLLFVIIPIDAIVGQEILYFSLISDLDHINYIVQIFGIILILMGTIVACWGRISRGTRAISWGIPQKLEKSGMYKYIRHPLYASYCYYFIGFVLALQSLLVFPLLLGIIGYYRLSKYEEDILIEVFKDEYREYQQNVGRFFPRLW